MTANTVGNAVATREAGPVSLMWKRGPHFAAVLPDHIDVKAFLGTAAGALYASADLMAAAEASPDSLITALMRCAALGHQPGTDEFYLTPRKVKGRPTILGIEGYRGIVERMYRSGAVKSVIVREVCAKDKFKFVEGEMDKPQHATGGADPYNSNSTGADFFGATGSRDRGQMVGVYAYAILTTGAVSRVVILTRDDVMAAREASDSKNSDFSPWNRMDGGKDHPEFQGRAMWWKTAARRLEPWVPTSAEYRREQLRAASAASAYAGTVDPRDGSAPVPVTAAQSAQLAESGISTDIHDAEIVGEPGEGAGPTTAPDAGGSASTAAPAPQQAARPSGAALGKLGKLLKQVPLGTPDDDAAFLEWIANRPASLESISKDACAAAIKALEQALENANGNADEAASLIWSWYKAAHEQGAEAPDGQD